MLLPLPSRRVRFSRNPDQAPSKALQVVTGYCRPSGQDFSAAASDSILKHVVLQAWDRNRVFPQDAALIDGLRDLNCVFPRGFSGTVILVLVARRDASLSGRVSALLGC